MIGKAISKAFDYLWNLGIEQCQDCGGTGYYSAPDSSYTETCLTCFGRGKV